MFFDNLLRGNTKLHRGNFIFNSDMDYEQVLLEKFAFSNALSLSGKLEMFLLLHMMISSKLVEDNEHSIYMLHKLFYHS